jgi:hypothetical protein
LCALSSYAAGLSKQSKQVGRKNGGRERHVLACWAPHPRMPGSIPGSPPAVGWQAGAICISPPRECKVLGYPVSPIVRDSETFFKKCGRFAKVVGSQTLSRAGGRLEQTIGRLMPDCTDHRISARRGVGHGMATCPPTQSGLSGGSPRPATAHRPVSGIESRL